MSRLTSLPLAFAVCALALGGCQSTKRNAELAYVERPVEQLYNQAAAKLDSRDFPNAILLFSEVERQHPYSEWARKSMVMSAYASYKTRDYTTALAATERYLALHPGGSEAEYAYYLTALCYFDQITDVGRDQATTEQARTALNDIVRRFPESEYAKDARIKLDMVNDQLAGKEMTVGRWYLRSNQTLAAVNRFRNVVETYQTTSHAPEALHRLVEAYLTLGLKDQALAAGATLGYNYPDTDWYKMSYRLLTNEGVDLEAVSASQRRTLIQRLIPGGK
ncbi:MAG: outer membrane protein assembly factor BamD [Hyphomonas sp.]|uniref:outer membrane protein assembly factor BamD n=1 Tax=Hyphomonas sp. TaxID=87 RepID=UPI0017B09C83|nr:outer membrane protein assembly factor BamD [Hyphomonas sp.]MBA3068427.1 outer membrane protein assembly factor BamD [Hyphomonas sp.]MBU3919594.1 outer membrane protein assembly factor BamD [Alphaproteobacteria bacterium]MBU4060705.1 outer membrane protein assembly factor BamD [Alphaproteobacteria bacterium]MBU4164689.1 outer membrane protein assembly factor BamD [Alphaproteobacteria bacterium]